jgi:hypothetical protein
MTQESLIYINLKNIIMLQKEILQIQECLKIQLETVDRLNLDNMWYFDPEHRTSYKFDRVNMSQSLIHYYETIGNCFIDKDESDEHGSWIVLTKPHIDHELSKIALKFKMTFRELVDVVYKTYSNYESLNSPDKKHILEAFQVIGLQNINKYLS